MLIVVSKNRDITPNNQLNEPLRTERNSKGIKT